LPCCIGAAAGGFCAATNIDETKNIAAAMYFTMGFSFGPGAGWRGRLRGQSIHDGSRARDLVSDGDHQQDRTSQNPAPYSATGKKDFSPVVDSVLPVRRSGEGQKGQEPPTPEENTMKTWSVIFSFLLLTTMAVAGSPDNQQVDARAAFARLKSLAGEWQADTPKGRAQVRYEVIAGGSVLLEHDRMPGHDEMLTAYHLDGDKLVLTHYCMAGNQPHMVAQRFDDQSGELEFVLAGGTNLDAGPGHMQNARFHLVSGNRLDAVWNFLKNDKTSYSEDLHYTRVQ
jgi:hypothetical protein